MAHRAWCCGPMPTVCRPTAAQALRFDSCLQSVALVAGQPPVASADQVVFGEAPTMCDSAGDRLDAGLRNASCVWCSICVGSHAALVLHAPCARDRRAFAVWKCIRKH